MKLAGPGGTPEQRSGTGRHNYVFTNPDAPLIDRMNADEQDQTRLFICILHLRVSVFICG